MPRIAVNVDDEDVYVCFGGLDVVWTLRRTVRIPRTHVAAVQVGPSPPRRGLRFPATHVPGLLAAGTWHHDGRKELWDVRRGERVLVIECAEDAAFRRVVLEVPDPDAVAARFAARSPAPRNLSRKRGGKQRDSATTSSEYGRSPWPRSSSSPCATFVASTPPIARS